MTSSSTEPSLSRRRYGGVLPEERQRQRRIKLIEGATEVFGTKGFHASTVREVCVAAHLTERYFYESFKTLSELFIAVYVEMRQQLMDRTLKVFTHADQQPLELVESSLRVFLEFIKEDPRRGQVMLVDALGINSEVARISGDTARDYGHLVRARLMSMVSPKAAQDIDMGLLADGMVGLNILLAARWMQDGFKTPLDKVVRTNTLPYLGLLAVLGDSAKP
ncbi:MAG: TetR/AcrR family transcriptional regulator [Burkholderiales bacterium]|nr:TetR/AcrR family transcriptional regulator [Burkholderiales bacterium]MDE2433441.1 TetR/AcrR family transcriptional regulator [Burkholderiales bacterium]